MRSLHAVLVGRATPRLVALLAAALDGTGPAVLPLDARLPTARLDKLLDTLAPDTVEDPAGVITVRSGEKKGLADSTAVIVVTSGSTGPPKGVELSAAALLHSARVSLARLGARPGERWLCCLPAAYIPAIQVLVRSLVSGTDPVLADRADGETVAASGCAHVSLVPTQLRRLLPGVDMRANADVPTPLAGFRSVLLGGAATPADLLDAARAARVPVVTTYGMTETCGGCVYDGIPLDGVRVAISAGPGGDPPEPAAGGTYPPGPSPDPPGAGRIWIAGPVLFSGYRPGGYGGTGSALVRAGSVGALGFVSPDDGAWFRTGDLGRLDASGRLVVCGRADDVINTGGHLVVPGEVTAALQTCPGVRDAVVIGQPDREWGERVLAVVVPADPADPPGLELLRLHVREHLPRYAAPSRVVMVDAIPVLPSGKHDVARLRRDLLRREQTETESVTK
jgi:o-succinylbenzoate---CoA ligase